MFVWVFHTIIIALIICDIIYIYFILTYSIVPYCVITFSIPLYFLLTKNTCQDQLNEPGYSFYWCISLYTVRSSMMTFPYMHTLYSHFFIALSYSSPPVCFSLSLPPPHPYFNYLIYFSIPLISTNKTWYFSLLAWYLQFHLFSNKLHNVILFNGLVISHCVDTAHFLYAFICWWVLRLIM
jgi:hypothetical protein